MCILCDKQYNKLPCAIPRLGQRSIADMCLARCITHGEELILARIVVEREHTLDRLALGRKFTELACSGSLCRSSLITRRTVFDRSLECIGASSSKIALNMSDCAALDIWEIHGCTQPYEFLHFLVHIWMAWPHNKAPASRSAQTSPVPLSLAAR